MKSNTNNDANKRLKKLCRFFFCSKSQIPMTANTIPSADTIGTAYPSIKSV